MYLTSRGSPPPTAFRAILFALVYLSGLLACLAGLSGCAIFGVAAQALPPPTIQPRYVGLQGQRVAVMAWAEHSILLDWANMPLDITGMVQSKLHIAEKECPEGNEYPVS